MLLCIFQSSGEPVTASGSPNETATSLVHLRLLLVLRMKQSPSPVHLRLLQVLQMKQLLLQLLKIRRWLGDRQLCNSRCSCHFLMTFQREFYKIYCVWIARPFYMALVGMAGLLFTSQSKKFALCVECHCQVHVLNLARKQGMVVILPPMQWLSKR